tara:strand:+ start:254 stop:466 length:213 start_codon:yes stop_codon:yes gene_type:complete
VKLVVKKESPSCKNSKSRKNKCNVLKPMGASAINSIFIELGISQFSMNFIKFYKRFSLNVEYKKPFFNLI